MRKWLCKIGLHKYRTIEMTSCFTTTYTDRPHWSPIKHMVWYQICTCCGKRRMKDTVKKDGVDSRHNGVEYARVGWVEYGYMHLEKGVNKKFPPGDDNKHASGLKPFEIIEGGKR